MKIVRNIIYSRHNNFHGIGVINVIKVWFYSHWNFLLWSQINIMISFNFAFQFHRRYYYIVNLANSSVNVILLVVGISWKLIIFAITCILVMSFHNQIMIWLQLTFYNVLSNYTPIHAAQVSSKLKTIDYRTP